MPKPYAAIQTVPDYIEFLNQHRPPEALVDTSDAVKRALWSSAAGLVVFEETRYKCELTISEVRPTHFEESGQPYDLLDSVGPTITPEATQDGLPSLTLIAVQSHALSPFPGLHDNEALVEYRLRLPHERQFIELRGLPDPASSRQSHFSPQLAACILWELGVFKYESLADDPTTDEPITPSDD